MGPEQRGRGERRQGRQSELAFLRIKPTTTTAVRREPGTKWSIYWLNEKIAFPPRLPEDPAFNVRDAGDPTSNGFSVFVVQRHEKMKFADRLTEMICSHKGVFFISSLKAANELFVIKHVRCACVVGR